MPTHQKLTSQTDDVIPQPMRGREGAWMDHTSGLKHPIDKELARDFTRHHGILALLPADPSLVRHISTLFKHLFHKVLVACKTSER